MKISALFILAILDWGIYSIIAIPFIKRFGGKVVRLIPMLLITILINMQDLVFGEAYPKTAYAAIVCYSLLVCCFYYALGQSLSLSVVTCGICVLTALPLDIFSELLLMLFGFDINQMDYYTYCIMLMSMILVMTIVMRILLLPVLVRYVSRKLDFVKSLAIVIINGLFAFSIFKQYLNFSGVPYYYFPIPLMLFLTGVVFVYREMMDDRNIKQMLEQHRKIMDSVQPIIEDIRSRQHEYKNQINVIKLNLQLQGAQANPELIEHIDALNKQFLLNDKFLAYSMQALGALMYLKYHEAVKAGVAFSVENQLTRSALQFTDELTIISLLSNLIDNAIQASSDFSGDKSVHILLESNDRWISISVRNTGTPISESLMRKIFQRGFSTKQKHESEPRGYGLFNVKKLVDKMKGRIEIISENDMTTFTVIIPLASSLPENEMKPA